jgi:hypothetical protein
LRRRAYSIQQRFRRKPFCSKKSQFWRKSAPNMVGVLVRG